MRGAGQAHARWRGSALLGVLVLVTIGSLVGTTVLLGVDAQRQSTNTSMRQDQARALAWSGVLAAMSELAEQREDLLAGLRPELTGEWILFTDEAGREGVVRLLAVDGEGQELAQSECGKLDINHVTNEMLTGLDAIDETLAQAIVDARPFASVVELLEVEGVTPALLYGEAQGEEGFGGSFMSESRQSAADAQALYSLSGTRLIDLLTVYSFEPNVQAGLDDEQFRGNLRLNFDVEWSDELGDAVGERFGDEAVPIVQQLFEAGTSFATDADVCRVVQQFAPTDYETWAEVLDVLTTSDDEFRLGRIDLNAAPAAVLACVPGIDQDAAEQLVATREMLSETERQSVVWPLTQGVLESEQFIEAVDWLATRSLQYRVRIEGGWRSQRAGGTFDIGGPSVSMAVSDEPLEHRRVVEAVIDVASSKPRVAYLWDVTMLGVARAVASESRQLGESLAAEADLFADDPIAAMLEDDPRDRYADRSNTDLGEQDPLTDPGDPFDTNPFGDPMDDPMGDEFDDPMGDELDDPMDDPLDGEPDERNPDRTPIDPDESASDQVMVDRRIGRWTDRRAAR